MDRYIYHITTPTAWKDAEKEGQYTHPSLEQEGFIHCSDIKQVAATANRHFQGQDHLLVLEIDMAEVEPDIVLEDNNERNEYYPHIYGPLNTNSVRQVFKLEAGTNGQFSFSR